jgi:hypothetical protein
MDGCADLDPRRIATPAHSFILSNLRRRPLLSSPLPLSFRIKTLPDFRVTNRSAPVRPSPRLDSTRIHDTFPSFFSKVEPPNLNLMENQENGIPRFGDGDGDADPMHKRVLHYTTGQDKTRRLDHWASASARLTTVPNVLRPSSLCPSAPHFTLRTLLPPTLDSQHLLAYQSTALSRRLSHRVDPVKYLDTNKCEYEYGSD